MFYGELVIAIEETRHNLIVFALQVPFNLVFIESIFHMAVKNRFSHCITQPQAIFMEMINPTFKSMKLGMVLREIIPIIFMKRFFTPLLSSLSSHPLFSFF
jgi:hypothetical protein